MKQFIKILFVLFALSFAQSAWAVTAIPNNSAFTTAITECLNESPVTGDCTTYGASSGYGSMPNWDVSNVTDMSSAFSYNTSFNADLSSWDTSAVTDMSYMFEGATSITNVSFSDTSSVTSMERMFRNATSFASVSLPKTGAVTNMFKMFRGTTSLTSVSLPETGAVTNMDRMFRAATSLTSVSLPETGVVTNMFAMFYGATSLTSVSLPETGAVTNMSSMFDGAIAFNQDIRSWDVENVTNFGSMFDNATAMSAKFSTTANWANTPTAAWFTPDTTAPTMTITASEVSDGDTSNDATLSLTFTSSEATTDFVVGDITVSGGALSGFAATSSTVYTATFTPSGAGATTVDVASSKFTDPAGNNNTAATQFNWTYDTTAACTVNGQDYRTIYDTSGTYITLDKLTDRAGSWNNSTDLVMKCDVSQFTSMYRAFRNNSSFNQDISAWDVSNVTNMNGMFQSATGLNSVSFSDTSSVTDMGFMFASTTNLTSVSLSDTSDVTDMNRMFYHATSLTSVSLPETGAVTNMFAMFYGATSLTSVSLPETGAVTNMNSMFDGATSLTSVSLPKTGAVTIMSYMFNGASSLSSVSLPETGAVTVMSGMFSNATSFDQDIRDLKVSEATDFDGMFSGATAMIAKFSTTPNWPSNNATPTAAWFDPDTTVPTISSVSLNAANSELTVTFSESVYDNTGGSGDLEVGDFAFSISGGAATVTSTPASIAKTSASVWVLGITISGTATGSETLSVAPASANSIYDVAGNAASTTQTGNSVSLDEKVVPTLSIASIASNNAIPTQAVENDVVTLTLTASETISTPVVTFESGAVAITDTSITYENTTGNIWTATYTVSADDTAGAVSYSIAFSDSAGNVGTAVTSGSGSVTVIHDSTAPTISSVSIASNNSTTTEGFAGDEVTLTFTAGEPIGAPTVTFKSGGAAVTDTSISYSNDSGNTWTATYTVNASDTAGAVTYSIAFSDSAGNVGTAVTTGTGSVTIYPTPAVAFAAELTNINTKIASFAQAELSNLSATMVNASSSARSRFMSQMRGSEVKVSSSAPDYSGGFNASGGKINTNLSVTQSSKSASALYNTYSSSDVFFNRLDDGSQSTGVASQIQFERMLNDRTMLGYFIGGSIGLTSETGTLSSYMRAISAKFGTYFVQELTGGNVLDGYAGLTTTHNSLSFSTDNMIINSSYVTQGQVMGLNLTGSIPLRYLEIRPTGSFSLTRSFGQMVNFDVAVGSASSTEAATHGPISQADLFFAPEVRIPLDTSQVTVGEGSVVTFAPKLTCQQTSKTATTRQCGQGITLGFDIISKNGLTNITAQTSFNHMKGQTSAGIKLNLITKW